MKLNLISLNYYADSDELKKPLIDLKNIQGRKQRKRMKKIYERLTEKQRQTRQFGQRKRKYDHKNEKGNSSDLLYTYMYEIDVVVV